MLIPIWKLVIISFTIMLFSLLGAHLIVNGFNFQKSETWHRYTISVKYNSGSTWYYTYDLPKNSKFDIVLDYSKNCTLYAKSPYYIEKPLFLNYFSNEIYYIAREVSDVSIIKIDSSKNYIKY